MYDVDPNDKVVRELDVYVATDLASSGTQLCICQFPLRPPWRPYDVDQVNSVRFKNTAKRLEVDVPIETSPENYNEDVESFRKLTKSTLRSSKVDTKTTYAVGVLAGDKIILSPIDYCLQLRPTMSYLDSGKKAAAKDDDAEEDEEDNTNELAAVEVQVKKRETERQQLARLNSYAHLTQKEEEEPWIQLNVHPSGTPVSNNIWDTFIKPTETETGKPMQLASYLAAVVPQRSETMEHADNLALPAPTLTADQSNVSEEVTKGLPKALNEMLEKRKVCSMANIRQWLPDYLEATAAKEAVALTDRTLHETVLACGNIVCIRRVYMLVKTGVAAVDPIRGLVIELLKDKESIKKGEVAELAKARKVTWHENTFGRVAKEMCFSRGNFWVLKPNADA